MDASLQAGFSELKQLIHELVRIDYGGYSLHRFSFIEVCRCVQILSILKRLITHLWPEDP